MLSNEIKSSNCCSPTKSDEWACTVCVYVYFCKNDAAVVFLCSAYMAVREHVIRWLSERLGVWQTDGMRQEACWQYHRPLATPYPHKHTITFADRCGEWDRKEDKESHRHNSRQRGRHRLWLEWSGAADFTNSNLKHMDVKHDLELFFLAHLWDTIVIIVMSMSTYDLIGSLGEAGKNTDMSSDLKESTKAWTMNSQRDRKHAESCCWLVTRLLLTEHSGEPCEGTDLYFDPLFFREGIQACQYDCQQHPSTPLPQCGHQPHPPKSLNERKNTWNVGWYYLTAIYFGL